MAKNDYNIGNHWFYEGNLPEAEAAFQSAIQVCEEAMRRGDHSQTIRQDLAKSLVYLGRIVMHLHGPEAAIAPLQRAIPMDQALIKDYPGYYEYEKDLHYAYQELSFAYQRLNRPDDVIACHEASRDVLEAAASRHMGVVSRVAAIREQMAIVNYNIANVCEDDLQHRLDRVRSAYAEALEICDKLALVEPLSDSLKQVMVFALSSRINARIENGEQPDLNDYARIMSVVEEMHDQHPKSLLFRVLSVLMPFEWADELEAVGRADEARACRERASARLKGDHEAWFEAATNAAAELQVFGTYPMKLDADQRQARRQRIIDRALRLLEGAIAEGFRDARRLHRSSEFAPLAHHLRYQAAVAAVDDRVFPADPFASR